MIKKGDDFNIWKFWEKIKGVSDAEKLKSFYEEFSNKTKGRKLTDNERTVECYLKARVNGGK